MTRETREARARRKSSGAFSSMFPTPTRLKPMAITPQRPTSSPIGRRGQRTIPASVINAALKDVADEGTGGSASKPLVPHRLRPMPVLWEPARGSLTKPLRQ